MLREAGATEVHLRISSPPFRWPCFYGIDTPDRTELLASIKSIEEIVEFLDVDSLEYLTLDHLVTAIDAPGAGFCNACLTGNYPVPVPVELERARGTERGGQRVAGVSGAVRTRPRHRPASTPNRSGHLRRGRRRHRGRRAGRRPHPPDGGLHPPARGARVARRLRRACSPSTPAGTAEPVLVAGTDGVGTKALVAQAVGRFDTIGIDLVAMCVDDLVCQGAEPLFLLDYISSGASTRPRWPS